MMTGSPAHLAEAVTSILSQTSRDTEILTLDDQSPVNTAEVAGAIIQSHPGRRIAYILNERNQGNVGNSNKGIRVASGRYVWILSTDDRFRGETAVEAYVRLFSAHPEVG